MNHNKFILSSISDMLVDVTSAAVGAGGGIETYPLCDYVMQSVFLKMTGAQEQKMKCICWEMATYDYEYRYLKYSQKGLGECSSYADKKEIFKDLVKQIEKQEGNKFDPSTLSKPGILNDTAAQVKNSFLDSNLLIWAQKGFNEYVDIWNDISEQHFVVDRNNLFTNRNNLPNGGGGKLSLEEIYVDHLYRNRNRVAHNTLSYQQNLPTLDTLIGENYKYDNYFIYFSILILIDNIFIKLFDRYLLSQESSQI